MKTLIFILAFLFSGILCTVQTDAQTKKDMKFLEACAALNLKKVQSLLASNVYVDVSDDAGNTALMAAIYGSNCTSIKNPEDVNKAKIAIVTALLEHGASVEKKANNFTVAYLNKRSDGNYEVIISKDKNGETSLISAVRNNSPDLVEILLSHHANVNAEFQPDPVIPGYSVSSLWQVSDMKFSSFVNQKDNVVMNINGVTLKNSEGKDRRVVPVVNSEPQTSSKMTVLKVALLMKKKNYAIIDKIASLSSHDVNSDIASIAIQMNDPQAMEILKKYGFVQ